ncbi:MAG: right-handed parallel beta-helix repeat-containing protein, partial [Pirellulales bacterium]
MAGVDIVSANGNTIGGETNTIGQPPGNTILDNGVGMILTSGAQHNHVEGNLIADSQGFNVPGGSNPGDGIVVRDGASNNQIGLADNADANSIHDNKGAGVDVAAGVGDSILHNQIDANTGLGILLDPAGGGNNLQTFPSLSLATPGRIAGWLQATPNTTYSIEFFTGPSAQHADGSEDDDAEKVLVPLAPPRAETGVTVTATGVTVTTNGAGLVLFDLPLPTGTAGGRFIRATATDSSGNTSEFSDDLTVQPDADGDGVPDAIENTAPGGDSQDASKVAFPDALNPNGFVSLQATTAGVTIQNAWSMPNPSRADAPTKTEFGLGFVDFTLSGVSPGQHVAVTMTLPVTVGTPTNYWRYGPTPNNPTPHWFDWNYNPATDTGAQINGNIITLHFVNGARGDEDLDANNDTIVDAGSPGFADPFTVTTTADSGPGSLRQAVLNANANPGTDEITFQIPGTIPQTIQPLSPLPAITDTVTIDGFRLPPSEAGDDLESATPLVELDGSLAGPAADGLTVASGYATIQGLVIDRFSGDGIHVLTEGNAAIVGNDLGTDSSGASGKGNGLYGIEIEANLPQPDEDNGGEAVSAGPSSVGGGNVISGNAKGGIYLHGIGADRNYILGNLIGMAADGVSPLGNGGPGLLIDGGASNNVIGNPYADDSNTIAYNAGPGVDILQGYGNLVEANSIFANTGLGIDLGGDGVTPNDDGDGDDGPNDLQNFPLLASAASYGGQTFITGTLNS